MFLICWGVVDLFLWSGYIYSPLRVGVFGIAGDGGSVSWGGIAQAGGRLRDSGFII